jgi:hypothetical protein
MDIDRYLAHRALATLITLSVNASAGRHSAEYVFTTFTNDGTGWPGGWVSVSSLMWPICHSEMWKAELYAWPSSRRVLFFGDRDDDFNGRRGYGPRSGYR